MEIFLKQLNEQWKQRRTSPCVGDMVNIRFIQGWSPWWKGEDYCVVLIQDPFIILECNCRFCQKDKDSLLRVCRLSEVELEIVK